MNYCNNLFLNSKPYLKEELVKLTDSKLSVSHTKDYEKHLYSFIKEWISAGDTIKVKTSGTTGEPKEISFLKKQGIESAKMTCEYFGLDKTTNALLCLSAEFIGGKMMVVRAFVSEMNLITIEPASNPLLYLDERIDFAAMVPMQVQNCLQDEKTKAKFLSIKNVIIGGAPVSHSLENMLQECTNNVYSTFAMTETLSHIALKKLSGKAPADYYECLPGIIVSKDERECLIIRAPQLIKEPVITNDMVEIISPSRFGWLGRYDHVINSGGIKINPEMLEKKLSPFIAQNRFFITSLQDNRLGEKVVMVIEAGEISVINNIIETTKGILKGYEIPREYYGVKKFIETSGGKIKKTETLKVAENVA